MVRKRAHGSNHGALLASAGSGGRDEDAAVFAPVRALLPLLARVIEEGLPLRGEIAVAGRDAEEEGVVGLQGLGRGEGDRRVLPRGVHLLEHLLGQRLLHLEEVRFPACGLDPGLFRFGQLADVPVHGVLGHAIAYDQLFSFFSTCPMSFLEGEDGSPTVRSGEGTYENDSYLRRHGGLCGMGIWKTTNKEALINHTNGSMFIYLWL